MNIVHVCLRGPYTDNWSYQDNIIPRIHKRFGHNVTVIAQNLKYSNSGEEVITPCERYTLDDGVNVIRIAQNNKFHSKRLNKLLRPFDLFPLMCELKPDLVMVHCLGGGISTFDVIKYKNKINPRCVLVTDNHEFPGVSAVPTTFKSKTILKFQNILSKRMYPYYAKIFCITPDCLDFAVKYKCVPREKTELLPLGYDPQLVDMENKESIRRKIRNKYSINENDLVLVHGGKIIPRRKTVELIEEVKKLDNKNLKLVIFGGISKEMKESVDNAINKNSSFVIYTGPLSQKEYYDLYLASDIAVFPGAQSVLWQEAIGCGLPLIIGRAPYIEYLDIGGNISIINDITPEGIFNELKRIIGTQAYLEMSKIAFEKGRPYFSYERISRQITDCVREI